MAQTAITILKDLPFSFLGLTATKPTEISSIVQILRTSIDFASDIKALGVLSGRNAPTLVATGLSKSIVPGGFRYKTRIKNTVPMRPTIIACDTMPIEIGRA